MGERRQSPGLARLSHLIERLKTDARLASDAVRAEGRGDVAALLESVKRNLSAAASKVGSAPKTF
jgi:hypothetical protein